MAAKDYFSGHSKIYATFRPTYPDELYRFIFGHLQNFDHAWDCATGNGQVARVLATQFEKVYATDISSQQLDYAVQAGNIYYRAEPAEKTSFSDDGFDLITVAQAIHWFNLPAFYNEVKRTARPDAWVAIWGYTNCAIQDEIDSHVLHFYREVVGPYWDEARKIVEDEYKSLPFPFDEIITPRFSIKTEWTADAFSGYLTSWSATQKFIKANGFNPVPEVMEKIKPLWQDKQVVTFPLFLRMGRVTKG
jgi:ubiquinone/menaquinone biosynthesis C-methylase UbiE